MAPQGYKMNKSQLIDAIAASADLNKAQAARAIEAVTNAISTSLSEGENVTLVGFGTFSVRDRAARVGRNPQNGAELNIPAARLPTFKAGKLLKEACAN